MSHAHLLWVVFGGKWMSEDFTGSDPLILTRLQYGFQELDALLSLCGLGFIIFLKTHLVEETTVISTIMKVNRS